MKDIVTNMALRKGSPGRPRKYKNDAEKMRAYRKRLKRSVHFRSDSHQWSTPQALFDELNAEFGFTVDVCGIQENAKCSTYFTPEQDGLQQVWSGVVWCNPPYGRVIGLWVKKAYEASQLGATVVCLLPSRTGPSWWQTYVKPYASEIRCLPGRLKFSGKGSAPFDSAVVIFRPTAFATDSQLLERLQQQKWSASELQWLRSHITTPEVRQAIDAKLQTQER